ncbi:MAG: hypothetical protein ACI9OJ_002206 [Myxococcota bacterium]|jgi:hypothetical protein
MARATYGRLILSDSTHRPSRSLRSRVSRWDCMLSSNKSGVLSTAFLPCTRVVDPLQ